MLSVDIPGTGLFNRVSPSRTQYRTSDLVNACSMSLQFRREWGATKSTSILEKAKLNKVDCYMC